MRTLYVHIGTPKTATTSIQMFCVENQKVLNKQSYKLSSFGFVYPMLLTAEIGHSCRLVYKPGGQEDVGKRTGTVGKGTCYDSPGI